MTTRSRRGRYQTDNENARLTPQPISNRSTISREDPTVVTDVLSNDNRLPSPPSPPPPVRRRGRPPTSVCLELVEQFVSRLALATNVTVRRMKWTPQLNENVMRAYFEAIEGGTNLTAYRSRILPLFQVLQPTVTVTAQRLSDQVRAIQRCKLLDDLTLDRLRTEILQTCNTSSRPCDPPLTSVVTERQQVAEITTSREDHMPESDVNNLESSILQHLEENYFLECCLNIFVDFCEEKEYKNSIEPNIPLSILERKSELEVQSEKCESVRVTPSLMNLRGRIPPTTALVTTTADLLYNLSFVPECPVKEWNEQGLYRILYKCATRHTASETAALRVRHAVCRALTVWTSHKCVRTTLAATKDCLHDLLLTLTPLRKEKNNGTCKSAQTQTLLFLASLMAEKSVREFLLREIRENDLKIMNVILQSVQSNNEDFQEAGLFCLTQLVQSLEQKKVPKDASYKSYIEFLDNIKSPYNKDNTLEVEINRFTVRDEIMEGCQPEFIMEELCKVLMYLYKKKSENKSHEASRDERWNIVCACLSSVVSASARARTYGLHAGLPQLLLGTLQAIRDHLSVHDKPIDTLKNAQHSWALRSLYWVLSLMTCSMLECSTAKERYAENGLAVSLNRLWPWCMMTEHLRLAAVYLLLIFTNNCPNAWSAMCSCVGSRTLMDEVCTLCTREATMHSSTRSPLLLVFTLRIIERTASHQRSRAHILKSEAISSVYKLFMRERTRTESAVLVAFARACESLARHPDGAAAVFALKPLGGLPHSVVLRTSLLPALAHVAHHHRIACLQSSEFLELLSGTLLTGDTKEIVSAARAVWALAANNHKAKLTLRSAGVAAAVQNALHRYQRAGAEPPAQRALHLLTYTNNILQTT